jgi:protoheme IX farnesyltransferase
MMPVVEGAQSTAQQTLYYTLALLPVTLLLVYPCGVAGPLYGVIALGLGVRFIQKAVQLLRAPEDKAVARSVFKFSILYMMLLSLGMTLDSLPVTQYWINAAVQPIQAFIAELTIIR